MTFYIVLSICGFLMSLLGTRITILALRQRQEMLEPFRQLGRKVKAPRPVPTGGGVAVVMSLIICLLVADVHYAIILSLFLLAAISLLDDLIGIPGLIHVLVQVLAVLIPMELFSQPFFGGMLPPWADRACAAMLWVWCINLFEFMDGVDGMTPTEMIGISFGLSLIAVLNDTFPTPLSTYGLVVFAIACGFMWWNWHPSKIRLGEVGTVPIGFIMGYLLLLALQDGYRYAAFILPAYYFSDAAITLVARALRGQHEPSDRPDYYYRKAISRGRRPDKVTRYVFGNNILLIALACFSVLSPELSLLYLGLSYMSVFMILGFFAYAPHNPRHEPF